MKLRLKQGGIVKLQNAAETIPTVIVADPMSKRTKSNSKSFMDFNKNWLLNRITLLGQNVRDVSNKLKFDYWYNNPDEVFGNFQSDPPYQNIKNKSDLELGKEEYNRIINNYNNAIVREPKDFSTSDKEFYKNTTHQGAFNSSTGVITLLHPISSPNADRYAKSIFIHEQQHSGLPNVQEAMISKWIEEHPGKLLRSGVTPDKYWDSPTEILSRRQQSMWENNIDPKSHISVDMLDPDGVMEFIDLEKSGKKPHWKNSVIDVPKDSPFYKWNGKGKMELYDNALLQRYTPEFLDFLFNNVAANTSNKSNDKLQYSKNGGTVKLQNTSETIPTIVVDPMSQRISQNNHLAQIMQRDAAKAEWERKVEAAERKADERINNEDDNLASQFMFSGETGEWSRGANTNARRAKYVAEELGLDGNKAFLDSYKKDGKTGAIAFGTTLLTAPMVGEFATYGLLGGAARLAGGMAGSAVGSWGLGKVGDWADNRLGTDWMGTTGRIVGGFAGWSPGSNFAYKGALDLASKAPSIARIGATKQFIGDVAGRASGRLRLDNRFVSEIEGNKIASVPKSTPDYTQIATTYHFDPRVKVGSKPISEAEKSGIIKSERPFYDQKVLDTAKLFAKEYGYPEPTTIEEIKNMYRRHNTFFRTVNDIQDNGYNTKLYNSLPEWYRKLSIEEQRKVLASKGYPLAFRTGVPSDKFMDQFVFVSPTLEENARYINGSLDHTVKLQRPFSFRDPKRWYLDADWRPYPKEYLNDQYKGSEIWPKGHTEVGNANPAQELKIATDKLIPVDIAKPTDKGTRLGNYFVKRINEDEFHNIPYNSSGRAIYRRIHPKYDDAPEYSLEYLEPERNLTREYPVFPELQDNYILKYLQSQGFKLPIKKQGGILKAQDGVPEIYGGELNPAVVKPKPVRFILRTDPITKNTPITHSSMKADPINKEDLGFFISKGSDDTTYNLIHANCSDATGECLEVLTGQDFTSGITTPISVSRKVRKVFEKQPEYTESGGGLFNSREQSFVVPWYDYRKAKDLHNETVLNSLLKKYSQDKRIHWSKEREDAIIKNWWEQHPKLKYDLDENNNVVNPSKR